MQVGVRQRLIGLLPRTLSLAMAAGIGLFLAHIGYQAGEGIGVVVADGATLVTLGELQGPGSDGLHRTVTTHYSEGYALHTIAPALASLCYAGCTHARSALRLFSGRSNVHVDLPVHLPPPLSSWVMCQRAAITQAAWFLGSFTC